MSFSGLAVADSLPQPG
ncbi:Protein of unknown function [Bacillus mycoides]|nr:Protein of unknown function [Bacillus mycoides]